MSNKVTQDEKTVDKYVFSVWINEIPFEKIKATSKYNPEYGCTVNEIERGQGRVKAKIAFRNVTRLNFYQKFVSLCVSALE